MASVQVSISGDVSKLTDREVMQAWVYSVELQDHLCPEQAYSESTHALWDELSKRGYVDRIMFSNPDGLSPYRYIKALLS